MLDLLNRIQQKLDFDLDHKIISYRSIQDDVQILIGQYPDNLNHVNKNKDTHTVYNKKQKKHYPPKISIFPK